jgi:hypothetical protein
MSKSLPKSVIDPKDRIEPPLTATGELFYELYHIITINKINKLLLLIN